MTRGADDCLEIVCVSSSDDDGDNVAVASARNSVVDPSPSLRPGGDKATGGKMGRAGQAGPSRWTYGNPTNGGICGSGRFSTEEPPRPNVTDSEETLDCSTEEDAFSLKGKTMPSQSAFGGDQLSRDEVVEDEIVADAEKKCSSSTGNDSRELINPPSQDADLSQNQSGREKDENDCDFTKREDDEDDVGGGGDDKDEDDDDDDDDNGIDDRHAGVLGEEVMEHSNKSSDGNLLSPIRQRGSRKRKPIVLSDYGC